MALKRTIFAIVNHRSVTLYTNHTSTLVVSKGSGNFGTVVVMPLADTISVVLDMGVAIEAHIHVPWQLEVAAWQLVTAACPAKVRRRHHIRHVQVLWRGEGHHNYLLSRQGCFRIQV